MQKQNKIILVICEGNSERAYLQELNRYLNESNISLHFQPYPSNGGQYKMVVSQYRRIRKANPRSEIDIWVDLDRYKRNDARDMDNYQNKPLGIPDFLFSHMNFEDFLVMHLESSKVREWHNSCISRNHFSVPSHSSEYLPQFKVFLEDSYTKGSIPFQIDETSLNYLKITQGILLFHFYVTLQLDYFI